MNWRKAFDTEHLSSIDLDGKTVTLKITGAEPFKIAGETGEASKILVRFEGRKKTTWVIPITVAACLGAMFGDDMDGWIGKRVTVRAEKVDAFGEMVDAVRPIGSPDITAPVTLKVRMGRRKVTMRLAPTGKAPDAAPPAEEVRS